MYGENTSLTLLLYMQQTKSETIWKIRNVNHKPSNKFWKRCSSYIFIIFWSGKQNILFPMSTVNYSNFVRVKHWKVSKIQIFIYKTLLLPKVTEKLLKIQRWCSSFLRITNSSYKYCCSDFLKFSNTPVT